MATAEVINAIQAVRSDDIIIAFMGPTGSGKSYFIDLLTGQLGRSSQRSGSALKSVTNHVQATRVKHSKYGDRLVLVDTPGFDDTSRSDMEILMMISEWLQKTYERDVRLSGLIYLHRITDNRMAGSPLKNLRMFGELCGDVAMNKVILVSNMWQKVKPEVGVARESELRDKFWKILLDKGSRVDRLGNAEPKEAWRIIEQLVKQKDDRGVVLLQEELVELEKKLNETQAGKTLYTALQKALDSQREALKSLLAQLENSSDPALTKELKKEQQKIEREFQKTFDEVKRLKVPFGRRILAFFFGKRARAKGVKVANS
ncbi:hypothetical protein P691DRAFT_773577 [Macrolepiota fuliginosa MF-IS2]|uniref:G domain-containing protein n=1 Tax=Macrolepiota fuliginosa MF-IS2 TaxID=1400762 RepID=A0A9P6C782_9AGAR|nr:hypothetical protein P691DRAFT_773577 [Macrolepiota fuliginosa MF-IS2]